ncbi:MAG: 3-dehydroquinate synthase [Actinobacteria bacterium]|nr:3-dehydroquinate synthase [Actinomycetota bacterium]
MRVINVKTRLRKYPILIESGITEDFVDHLKKNFSGFNKVVVITNNKVFAIHGQRLKELLDKGKLESYIVVLEDGEEFKNLESADYIYKKLIDFNIHRNDIVVAFGGGVIGDLGGFVASTFHRGVRLVQYPTTIIGQVDSSIGGKVVVNYNSIKNVIGNFYQPHMIIIDPLLITTLEEREIINGLAEIVKYGIVFDRKILKILEENVDEGNDSRLFELIKKSVFEEIIYRCCHIKSVVVEKDEFDLGYRNLLNFGHTIGHCIEKAAKLEEINHGQAVSMGMIVAIDISVELNLVKKDFKDMIIKLYRKLKLPYIIPQLNITDIIGGLKYDKKFTSTRNKFILLKGINKPVFYYNVSQDIVERCISKNMEQA